MSTREFTFWLIVVCGILFMICFMFGLDKRQERMMAERGYCYQQVSLGVPSWQYQKCK